MPAAGLRLVGPPTGGPPLTSNIITGTGAGQQHVLNSPHSMNHRMNHSHQSHSSFSSIPRPLPVLSSSAVNNSNSVIGTQLRFPSPQNRLPSMSGTTTTTLPPPPPPTSNTSMPRLSVSPNQQKMQPKPSAPTPQTITTSSPPKKPSSKAKKAKEKREAAAKELADKSSAGATTSSVVGQGGDRGSATFRDDDDINDVAAMGGVNLQEESQQLAGNAECIGQQIRSCKDEIFLQVSPLLNKINSISMF